MTALQLPRMQPGDVTEVDGLRVERSADGRHGRACHIDHDKGQVLSFLLRDQPSDGGRWFARIGEAGINYVCSWHLWPGVRREVVAVLRERAELVDGGGAP